MVGSKLYENPPPLLATPLGSAFCPFFRTFCQSRGFRRVNSHFGLLGLGVAPRFLQKVRARPEILTNKLGLLPRREAAEAALE